MGKNKKKNKPKKPNAEAAANSTLPSKDSSLNRDDPPARDDRNKPKKAIGAPSNACDLSKKERMESSHGYLNQPSNLPDGSGNMVRAGFQPVLPPPPTGVQNASPGRSDEKKNHLPARVQPGESPVLKTPDFLKTKGVSTSDDPADNNSSNIVGTLCIDENSDESIYYPDASQRRCDGASTSGISNPEDMQQSDQCGHYYNRKRIGEYINRVVKDEAKLEIVTNVPCPTETFSLESLPGRMVRCKESLPAQMVLDHLDEEVKYVWLAVYTFFYDRVARHDESSAQKFHGLKQNEGAKSTGTECAECHEKHPTENMLRPYSCKHYFCNSCLKSYIQGTISILGENFVSFDVCCPIVKCSKKRHLIFVPRNASK